MITFMVPGEKGREVTCDGCNKKVLETDAYSDHWKHIGTRKRRGLPIDGEDYCPKCQKDRKGAKK